MHLTIGNGRQSYVTLATNDEYALGALVLGYSLRRTNTDKELTILITEGVPHNFRELLKAVYDNIVVIKPQQSREDRYLHLHIRPDLEAAYAKLYCWKLIEFTKCVFLDADTIVLQNIDELFQRKELSAAPHTSWPDIFNSGVFVYRPCLETFYKLSLLAKTKLSFDGGDQGLLNEYFKTWSTETLDKHLPFSYNCSCWVLPNDNLMFYTRPTAWKNFGSQVKVAHFAGYEKPWKHRMAANDEAICQAIERLECSDAAYTTAEQAGVLALWWAIFFKRVKHQLSQGMFLSTTFEPVPPPPPPSPQDNYSNNGQEHNEFGAENQIYHPEFSDTSFDFLHSGQRVDESNRYEEYHEYFEPPKPTEPEHHKYYESRRSELVHHEIHHHQPGHYEDNHHHESPPPPPPLPQQDHCHHQNDQLRSKGIVFHPYVPDRRYEPPPQSSSPPLPQGHHQHQECHQEHSDQEQPQQQWQEQLRNGHHPQEETTSPPLPSAPQAESPYEQYHEESQHHPPPIQHPPTPYESSPPPPPPPLELRNDKDPLFFVPKPMCQECLQELQWSRRFVDPFHRGSVSPVPPQSRSKSRVGRRSQSFWPPGTQLIREVPKTPASPVVLDEDSMKTNSKEQRKKTREKERSLHQVQKGKSVPKKRLKMAIDRSRLVDTAKRKMQVKKKITSPPAVIYPAEDTNNRLIEPIEDLDASVEATPAQRRMKLTEVEKGVKTKAFLKLESEPTPMKATRSKKSHLASPTEAIIPKEVKAVLASPEKREKQQPPFQKLESSETTKEATQSAEGPDKVAEHLTEKSVVNSAPWLPRPKEIRNRSQKKSSEHEYFCDRHRPNPLPPEWRMFAWERGEIDYLGNDRFCNILARIRTTIRQSEDDAFPIGVWL